MMAVNPHKHAMPFRILNLFRPTEGESKDGLKQREREAIADLLHLCMYADSHLALSEDKVIDDMVATFDWDPAVAFETFESRSVGQARDALKSVEVRDLIIASARDRLKTEKSRRLALGTCRNLLSVDGARTPEESEVLAAIEKALAVRR
jgi:hypothetical protein